MNSVIEATPVTNALKVTLTPGDKGLRGGTCYRQCCAEPNANFFNHWTKRWYCPQCAGKLNQANNSVAKREMGHDLCTEEFEVQR